MNRFLKTVLPNDVVGITLAPFGVYISEKYINDKITINHESIHWEQQMETLVILFYIWYGLEWFVRLFVNGKNAYVSISFEHEAYSNENNLNYITERKPYSWFKYIKKDSK